MKFPWDSVISLGAGIFNQFRSDKRLKDERQYNSPAAQRKRLEDAGLNPAMMYSRGSIQNTSTHVPAPAFNPPAPNLELMQILAAGQDMRIKESQEDRSSRSFDQAYELGQINKFVAELGALKTQQEVDEFLSDHNKNWRRSRVEHEGGVIQEDFKTKQLNRKLLEDASGELNKYRKLLPQAQYELLQAKIKGTVLSNEWQDFVNKHQHDLVDPTADLTTRLIQGLIQELLRNAVIDTDKLPNFLNFLNN